MSDTDKNDEIVSIFDVLETDTAAEEDGKWFKDVMDDGTGIDLKIRALGSSESIKVRRRLDRKNKKLMKGGQYVNIKDAMDVLTEQIAEAVLLDWNGIYDRNKELLPFSKENALALLTKLPKFRDLVTNLSASMDNFRIEQREATEKN